MSDYIQVYQHSVHTLLDRSIRLLLCCVSCLPLHLGDSSTELPSPGCLEEFVQFGGGSVGHLGTQEPGAHDEWTGQADKDPSGLEAQVGVVGVQSIRDANAIIAWLSVGRFRPFDERRRTNPKAIPKITLIPAPILAVLFLNLGEAVSA